MKTGIVNIAGQGKKTHPAAANLFVEVKVSHTGVRFTGTEEQVATGCKIVTDNGFEAKVED